MGTRFGLILLIFLSFFENYCRALPLTRPEEQAFNQNNEGFQHLKKEELSPSLTPQKICIPLEVTAGLIGLWGLRKRGSLLQTLFNIGMDEVFKALDNPWRKFLWILSKRNS